MLVGLLLVLDEADCGCEGCLSVLMLASAAEWLAAAAAATPEQPYHRPSAINCQMRRIGFKAPLQLSGINCIAAIRTHRWSRPVPAPGIASGRLPVRPNSGLSIRKYLGVTFINHKSIENQWLVSNSIQCRIY